MSDIKDLWELGIAKGTQDERERIIELLKSSLRHVDWEGIFWEPETTGRAHEADVDDIIALIKGEQPWSR